MLSILLPILTLALMVAGLFFVFAMTVGMIRFPDAYTRLHAGTKGLTVGVGLILIGLAITGPGYISASKTLLVGIFLLITNPLSTHAIARASYRTGREKHMLVVDDYQDYLHRTENMMAKSAADKTDPVRKESDGNGH